MKNTTKCENTGPIAPRSAVRAANLQRAKKDAEAARNAASGVYRSLVEIVGNDLSDEELARKIGASVQDVRLARDAVARFEQAHPEEAHRRRNPKAA